MRCSLESSPRFTLWRVGQASCSLSGRTPGVQVTAYSVRFAPAALRAGGGTAQLTDVRAHLYMNRRG